MNKKSHIPSSEDFARAFAAIKERSRGLSEVRDDKLMQFRGASELHEFFILDSSEISFVVYVFYRWDRQIKEAEENGLRAKIVDAIFNSPENVGRGQRSTIDVVFEFDSHETVERDYEGNYYNRLHYLLFELAELPYRASLQAQDSSPQIFRRSRTTFSITSIC